jgi:hypothetical protein
MELGSRRVRPVGWGCLLLLGTWSHLQYFRGSVLAHLFIWLVIPTWISRLIILRYLGHFIHKVILFGYPWSPIVMHKVIKLGYPWSPIVHTWSYYISLPLISVRFVEAGFSSAKVQTRFSDHFMWLSSKINLEDDPASTNLSEIKLPLVPNSQCFGLSLVLYRTLITSLSWVTSGPL